MFDKHFIVRLADHFGLLSEEKMHGLTVVVRDLTMIDLDVLSRLHICEDLDGTWTRVAQGPERQQV
ncbi:hypothetical protein Tco_0434207, partial [Tanacetum coccineum]